MGNIYLYGMTILWNMLLKSVPQLMKYRSRHRASSWRIGALATWREPLSKPLTQAQSGTPGHGPWVPDQAGDDREWGVFCCSPAKAGAHQATLPQEQLWHWVATSRFCMYVAPAGSAGDRPLPSQGSASCGNSLEGTGAGKPLPSTQIP